MMTIENEINIRGTNDYMTVRRNSTGSITLGSITLEHSEMPALAEAILAAHAQLAKPTFDAPVGAPSTVTN